MAATAFLSPRLTGLPVIWDREEGGPQEPQSARVVERTKRLSRALKGLNLGADRRFVILCCPAHTEDRQVAAAAVETQGATSIIPVDWSTESLSRFCAEMGPQAVYLACEEGVDAWRGARGTGIMIGDGLGVLWWKALECRYAAESQESQGS